MGIGIVARNHKGLVMGSSVQTIPTFFSPEIAEAVAILRGILFAVDIRPLPITIESDAKSVVETSNLG